MQLFYNNSINNNSKKITFNKIESRHIIRVLRKKEGDILHITNGKGLLFYGKIIDSSEKLCSAVIIKTKNKLKEHPYNLHIAIAPTKNIERFEWFLEKATEIGIDKITPLLCEHSERKIIKPERLEKIIVAASKQSLHFNFPILDELTSFSDFISKKTNCNNFVAHCENQEKSLLKNLIKPKENVCVMIGPEGDFSIQEIKLALQNGFKPLSLGNTRLRTETAGIVACHSVAFINE